MMQELDDNNKILAIRERQVDALLSLTQSESYNEMYNKIEKFYKKKNRVPKEITTGILQIYIEENSKNFNRYRSYEKGLKGKPLRVKKCSWELATMLYLKKNPDIIETLGGRDENDGRKITPLEIQNLAKLAAKRNRLVKSGI